MRWRVLWWTLPVIGALSLSGCATVRSDPGGCAVLPLRDYDRATQAEVAREIEVAPVGARWPAWVIDYGALRAAVRACGGGR